jgi:hypothetical protein
MKINKIFIPLVERFIKVDNYDKMKSILDIGISGLNMIDVYYKSKENKIFMNEEIINIKHEKQELLNRINELELSNKQVREERNKLEYDKHKELLQSSKEMEEKYNNKIEILNNKIEKLINEKSEIQNDCNKNFFIQLEKQNEEKKNEINYFKSLLKENETKFNNILENEMNKLNIQKNKEIEELREENKKFKDKYETFESKSVKKGLIYENLIEDELTNYFNKKEKCYILERYSKHTGKGDFLITNVHSNIRIMLELKHTENTVSSSVKEQLPKFYDNLNDKAKQYDGGLLISSGKISGKKHFEIEELYNNKIVSFIEDYSLNMPEVIYTMIELLHSRIKEIRKNKTFSFEELLTNKVEYYKELKENYEKIKYSQSKIEQLLNNMKEDILKLFNIDVDEYILNIKSSKQSTKSKINDRLEEYIIKKFNEHPKIKDNELRNLINKDFKEYIELYKDDKTNGLSKRKITLIINKLKSKEEEKNILINTEKSK